MKYPKRFAVGGAPDVREDVLLLLRVNEITQIRLVEQVFLDEARMLSYDDVSSSDFRYAVLCLNEEGKVKLDHFGNVILR